MKSLSTRIMVIFSVVIAVVVVTISMLVQYYVVEETTKTQLNNAKLQRDQAIEMMEIAWESHLYHRKILLEERKQLLNDVTAIAFGIINKARNKFLSNEISETEAQKRVMSTIRNMRFSNGAGYFWIQDCQTPIPNMLMHPVVPALDNKPCDAKVCYTALEDGSNLNAKFIEISKKAKNNEAFLSYKWPKPTADGLSEIQPKVAFVKIYPEWGWLVGTGLYIDDIDKESNKSLEEIKEKIITNLASIHIAKSGYMFIIDKNDNFVAHPTLRGLDGKKVLRPDTGSSITKYIISEYAEGNNTIEYLWDKPGGQKGQYFKKVAVVSYFEPLDWYVCATVYKDELKAPAQLLMTKILLASTTLLFIALFFAWRLSKSISKPLVQLATTAKMIATDEINTIDSQATNLIEINSLTVSLQEMLASLNEANEQLRHTQKMEAIGQLAGGIAHDFNNMLAGIIGCTSILRKKLPQDSPEHKYIDLISDSANRAVTLSSQLLSFSRKQKLATDKIDLHTVIQDAIAILKNTVDKRISIYTELNANKYIVEGEYTQLQSIFINLGINASHAMPNCGELRFSSRIVDYKQLSQVNSTGIIDKDTSYIEVIVADTGCGMSEEVIEHIFEPFFTTKEQGQGTGLGLASVYGVIKQHNGLITVISSLGKGSQFKIYLPLASNSGTAYKSSLQQHDELTRGTGAILVVDDEKVIRVTLENMLTDCGYKVILAENGSEAFDIYTKQMDKIDLVVCDMVMPKMNGNECFLALKSINPDVKFIIASGFTKDNSIEEMRQKGLNGFIKKPFKGSEISAMIADIIKN